AHRHKAESRDEDCSNLLALFALDFDFSIPTNPHQFGKASSIVLIALVHADRQCSVCMPCIDANDGEFNPTKLMPKPACHRARLKADTLRQWRMFTKQLGQIPGIRLRLSLKNHL